VVAPKAYYNHTAHRYQNHTRQLLVLVEAGSDTVPCDVVVLKGTAVVNEATLTGESIPQMKEALVSTRQNTFASLIVYCVLF
jgi:P-type E1-E2 ATPase